MLGGIWGWLVEHLFEPLFKRLVEHLGEYLVLVWLFSKIWVGMALALAVTLVVVLIAWLVGASNDPPRQRALGGQHIWAVVVWLLIIVLALYVLW